MVDEHTCVYNENRNTCNSILNEWDGTGLLVHVHVFVCACSEGNDQSQMATPAHDCRPFTFTTYSAVAFRFFRKLYKIDTDEFVVCYELLLLHVHVRTFIPLTYIKHIRNIINIFAIKPLLFM